MKKSLRLKLAALLFVMTAGTIVISLLFNAFFLQRYYIKTKEQALLSVYTELKDAVASYQGEEEAQGNSSFSDSQGESNSHSESEMQSGSEVPKSDSKVQSDMDVPYMQEDENANRAQSDILNSDAITALSQSCEKRGVSVYSISKDGNRVFAFGGVNLLYYRLYQMVWGKEGSLNKETLEMTDDYIMQIVTDREETEEHRYLELYGTMEDGTIFFLMRVAIESVDESVSISNRFYGYVSSVSMLFCLVLLLIISNRFTKPILKLAKISQEMTALNFDAKYHGNSKDEIGILGNSMNELSETLEKTISELKTANLELQSDIKRKEEIEKMRTEFLSNVSHELKTPIALIQGYAEGLKDCVNDDEESRDYYCDVIIDESVKMNRMVKKLLTLNQIESGTTAPDIQRFSITDLVNGVLNSVNIMLKQKEITVYFDAARDYEVWADEYELEEVVTNYISNAINHCEGKKEIRVWLEDKGDNLRVNVFNTGQPIPEEDLPHIWDKFYKVDKARTREYGGNGIGLSIVKAIMDSLNQRYGVYNERDGVTFWFEADKRAERQVR